MFDTVVYTDYSGKSDRISYYAVKKCRYTGNEYFDNCGTKNVSSEYRRRPTDGELNAVRRALRKFPGAIIKTDCMYAVREMAYSGHVVEHVKGHVGIAGNEHADYLAKYGRLHPNYDVICVSDHRVSSFEILSNIQKRNPGS